MVGGEFFVGGGEDGHPDELAVVVAEDAVGEGHGAVGGVVAGQEIREGEGEEAVMGQEVAALGADGGEAVFEGFFGHGRDQTRVG